MDFLAPAAVMPVGADVVGCCCLPNGCFWVPRPVEEEAAAAAALAEQLLAADAALALALAPPPRTDWDSDSDGRGPLSRKGLPVA